MDNISPNHLSAIEAYIHRILPEIRSFSEQWIFYPMIKTQFRVWVKEIIQSDLRDQIDDRLHPESTLLIVLSLFQELRKQLVEGGFYSFRKREIEQLLNELIAEFPEDIVQSAVHNKSYQFLISKTKQDFSHLDLFSITSNHSRQTNQLDEQMQTHIDWINKWLTRPHFSKYKHYYEQLPTDLARLELKQHTIVQLTLQKSHPPTRRTLFQLLRFHEDFQTGIHVWHDHPQDPLTLPLEEQRFFELICEQTFELATPIYMQWIELLIEKKTKKHYKEAANYLHRLRKTLDNNKDSDFFYQFISVLKTKYKGYASFQEELKKYDYQPNKVR